MMSCEKKYIFGPVPSRRLGSSLGVDLIPFKYCSYDCVYCQLGLTTHKTVKREQFVPVEAVLQDLRDRLAHCTPDYITLSGSGEPTLYQGIKELIAEIKKITKVPVAVLTNSSLLHEADVRDALMQADLVVPSLDAGNEQTFQLVDRPHASVSFAAMLSGLTDFCASYTGQLWLEVFLLKGMNDSEDDLREISAIACRLKTDRIQLNTVARPTAEEDALAVPYERLVEIGQTYFKGKAEVIASRPSAKVAVSETADEASVLALLTRRPCTIEDIAQGLSLHPTQAGKIIEKLLARQLVVKNRLGAKQYFQAKPEISS